MNKNIIKYLTAMSLIIFASCSNDSASVTSGQKYFPAVKAIVANNCMSCHDPNGDWSGQPVSLATDGDITSFYIKIKESVADPVSPLNRRMPLNGTLTESEISTIVKWYDKGGKATD